MPTEPTITVNSRWQHKKSAVEVTVTRVTIGTVSYIAVDKSNSASLSH